MYKRQCIDRRGLVKWCRTDSGIISYVHEGNYLYGANKLKAQKLDVNTGEVLVESEFSQYFEGKRYLILGESGRWVYEDYFFVPIIIENNHDILIFNKDTLDIVGLFKPHVLKGEFCQLANMQNNLFYYSKGKIYYKNTSDVLKIYEVDL